MTTITIELPDQTPLAALSELADRVGCELRLTTSGNYKAVPRQSAGASRDSLARIAADYREEWGRVCGFVILFNGEAVGWKRELDNPESFEPGCIAIDLQGRKWVTQGGTAYHGAERWEFYNRQPTNVTRMPTRIREIRQPGTA